MSNTCDTACIIVAATLGSFGAILIAVIIYFITTCVTYRKRLKRINDTLNITNDIPMDNVKTIPGEEAVDKHSSDDEYITINFNDSPDTSQGK
ncbi:hypothetical protein F-liban_269 [Faustovirus]|nr:hypothetical protein F-liban_269 [Faustovirus]SME64947.1 Hypothetical protein FSTVST1_260 [Faustovirus ST1]